jgi:hypothetical protein
MQKLKAGSSRSRHTVSCRQCWISGLTALFVTRPEFDKEMVVLLNDWCARRAFQALRVVLPHYPMINGFTDESPELARSLKTVRAQLGSTLPPDEFDRVVALLHAAEAWLDKHDRRV